jgi:hypothetical protein
MPSISTSGAEWPDRVTENTPTIFAELLLSGNSVSLSDIDSLQDNICDAIKKYLCPRQQNVWVAITHRQICNLTTMGVRKD